VVVRSVGSSVWLFLWFVGRGGRISLLLGWGFWFKYAVLVCVQCYGLLLLGHLFIYDCWVKILCSGCSIGFYIGVFGFLCVV